MKILNSDQIKMVDSETIYHLGIASIDLMEQACIALTGWFLKNVSKERSISIFCGPGNNGGDGLGLARLLIGKGYKNISCYLINPNDKLSKDCSVNKDRLLIMGVPIIEVKNELPEYNNYDMAVDAIFGSGLNRTPRGIFKEVINTLNNNSAEIISIDIPSGLFSEYNKDYHISSVIRAHHTLYLQIPKLSLLLPEYSDSVGHIHKIDIGLSGGALEKQVADKYLLNREIVSYLIRSRKKYSHKGNYGHAKLVGGSMGKMGAIFLSSYAALRAGAGLVSVVSPSCGTNILQTLLPEAMVDQNEGAQYIKGMIDPIGYTLGVGPGMGMHPDTTLVLSDLLERSIKPMVLDADALNIIAANSLFDKIPQASILTPHPKEFQRLVGAWSSAEDKLKKLKDLSITYNIYVVLKGAHSVIAFPNGQLYFNNTGNPGMATAGSGDVLTGVITGLLVQSYSPGDATILGVYLHGLAGDLAIKDIHPNSLMASDIINYISPAFRSLES